MFSGFSASLNIHHISHLYLLYNTRYSIYGIVFSAIMLDDFLADLVPYVDFILVEEMAENLLRQAAQFQAAFISYLEHNNNLLSEIHSLRAELNK